MKKITTGLISTCLLFMAGCTTVPEQKKLDIEPALVGRPVADRIQDTQFEITDQLALLDSIKSGKKVGSYNVVTHNNELDARIGSTMTIPKAYANLDKVNENKVTAVKKVKKIDWQNNSLNKLSNNIAQALGYQVVIKAGSINDKNINFSSENQTMQEVIDKLKKEVSPFADIVVIPQNKTFNIFYK